MLKFVVRHFSSRIQKYRISGFLFSMGCSILVGAHMVVNKLILQSVDVLTMVPILAGFATFFSLLPLLKARYLLAEPLPPAPRRAYGYVFVHSVLASIGMYTGLCGLKLLSPTVASFLGRAEVLFSVACAILFLGEVLDRKRLLGILFAVAGVIILAAGHDGATTNADVAGFQPGIFLVLISAAAYGSCEFFAVKGFRFLSTQGFVFLRSVFNFVLLTALAFWEHGSIRGLSIHLLSLLCLSAFLGPYLGRVFFMASLKRIPLTVTVGINQSQPLFAALIGLLFFMKLPTPLQWVGGACILAGCILLIRRNQELAPPLKVKLPS